MIACCPSGAGTLTVGAGGGGARIALSGGRGGAAAIAGGADLWASIVAIEDLPLFFGTGSLTAIGFTLSDRGA